MNPLLGVVAGLPLYTFALAVDLGVAGALVAGALLARRRGLFVPAFLDAAVWVLGAALVGGRLGYVLLYWPEFASNLPAIFYVWEGGLFLPGAITLVAVVALVAARAHRLPAGVALDCAAPGVALAQAMGHLGCLAAGCAAGVAGEHGWQLPLADATGTVVPRFPSQIAEAVAELALASALAWLAWRGGAAGLPAAVYLVGYGLLRLLAEPLRADSVTLGPFAVASWWAGGAALLGAWLLRRTGAGGVARPPTERDPAPDPLGVESHG